MPEPYWKSDLHEAVSAVFAQHIGDPYRQDPVWISIGERLTTSRDLSDFFHQMNADGFPLEESKILQQLLVDTETVTPWLVYDILPQLQVTRDRFQTLDAAVDSISRRFSAFVKDISEALPGYYDPLYFPNNSLQKRLNDLSAVLQQHNAIRCLDDDKGRIQALEEMVKENRDQMDSLQSISAVAEYRVAGSQELERAMQAHQPTFATLPDASESSTCTLTPASTIVSESINGNDNTGHDDEIPTAPLQLSVIIYTGGGIHRHNRPGPAQHVIVRMYPHTPFKHLADKLRERWGDRELRLSELPCEYVFDGDTPASLKLKKEAQRIYANIYNEAKTLDLTML